MQRPSSKDNFKNRPLLPHGVNAGLVTYSQAGYIERATGSGPSLTVERGAVTMAEDSAVLGCEPWTGGFKTLELGQIVNA